jgi:hypothetical protein
MTELPIQAPGTVPDPCRSESHPLRTYLKRWTKRLDISKHLNAGIGSKRIDLAASSPQRPHERRAAGYGPDAAGARGAIPCGRRLSPLRELLDVLAGRFRMRSYPETRARSEGRAVSTTTAAGRFAPLLKMSLGIKRTALEGLLSRRSDLLVPELSQV